MLVYSTDLGKVCPECCKPKNACVCKLTSQLAVGDGVVRIKRQTKGRKGKGVSMISGLPLNEKQLLALAKQLKKKSGCGGTVKDGVIEIQGDCRTLLKENLEKIGYNVKLAGG